MLCKDWSVLTIVSKGLMWLIMFCLVFTWVHCLQGLGDKTITLITIISFWHLSSIWKDPTAYYTAEINATTISQCAASLPLCPGLSPALHARARFIHSEQQLRAARTSEMMKQTWGYILLESMRTMLIIHMYNKKRSISTKQLLNRQNKLSEMQCLWPLWPQ